MMTATNLIVGFALAITALLLLFVAAVLVRRTGHWLNLGALAAATYVIVIPLSGLVHIFEAASANHGYYNLFAPALGRPGQGLVLPTVVAMAGGVGLAGGLLINRGPTRAAGTEDTESLAMEQDRPERHVLLVGGAVLLGVGLLAYRSITSSLAAENLARVLSVSGGDARIAFLAQWLGWAACFLCLGLVGLRPFSRDVTAGLFFLTALGGILVALHWTGARTEPLLFAAPLLMTMAPRLRRLRWVLLVASIAISLGYIVSLTNLRATTDASGGFSLESLLDWQIGRFSMLGFASDFVQGNGFTFGTTYAWAAMYVPNSIAHFLGLSPLMLPFQSSTQITGAVLLGDPSLTYIVPGLPPELYLNFGIPGTVVGMWALGWATTKTDDRFRRARATSTRLFWAYLGILLVHSIPSASESLPGFLLLLGLPVIIVALIGAVRGRRTLPRSLMKESNEYALLTVRHARPAIRAKVDE